MKRHALEELARKRRHVHGRYVVGIDPAKDKHQVQVLTPEGLPLGPSFSFRNNFDGFHHKLFKRLGRLLPELSQSDYTAHLVFAVETSCNLWKPLVHFLHAQGMPLALVSPLTTRHARPRKSGDYSRTDPKDAHLIARCAQEGDFHFFVAHAPEEEAAHRLAILYDKLRKDRQRHYARLRAQLERLFPELLKVLKLSSRTARHLLRRYLTPQDYLALDIDREAQEIMQISRAQHGHTTLLKLQVLARRSIGQPISDAEAAAERLATRAWLTQLDVLEAQIEQVTAELVRLAEATPHYAVVRSLKGISDLLAALFVAELYDPLRYRHWKQVERHAGCHLYVSDSGRYRGRRRISHLGNSRLRWLLYQMASETSKYVPEVRCKYLRRPLAGHKSRTKNLMACIPQLLQRLMALLREERPYACRGEALQEVERLEAELEARHVKRKRCRAA